MSGCHLFVEELVELTFSAQSNERKVEVATLMLRSILEDHPGRQQMNLSGFRRILVSSEGGHSEEELGELGSTAGPYMAGERVGKALGQAMNRKISKADLRRTLRAILCEEI